MNSTPKSQGVEAPTHPNICAESVIPILEGPDKAETVRLAIKRMQSGDISLVAGVGYLAYIAAGPEALPIIEAWLKDHPEEKLCD